MHSHVCGKVSQVHRMEFIEWKFIEWKFIEWKFIEWKFIEWKFTKWNFIEWSTVTYDVVVYFSFFTLIKIVFVGLISVSCGHDIKNKAKMSSLLFGGNQFYW